VELLEKTFSFNDRTNSLLALKGYIYIVASLRLWLGFVKEYRAQKCAKGRMQEGNGHHHIYQNKKRMAQISLLIE